MNSKFLLLVLISFLIIETSCKKEVGRQTPAPPPYLTEKKWTLDTITIDPPATYDALSDNEKFSYQVALGWATNAELTFNADGTVVTGGDWDFGYQSWKLINDDADIEVSLAAGMDTLREWFADNTRFTYVSSFGESFDCTFIYK